MIRAAITPAECLRGHRRDHRGRPDLRRPPAARWDYRYCWLRDAWFVVAALSSALTWNATSVHHQSRRRFATRELRPVYGLTGEARLDERIVTQRRATATWGPAWATRPTRRCRTTSTARRYAAAHVFYDEYLPSGRRELFRRLETSASVPPSAARPSGSIAIARVHTFSAVMCWAPDRLARIAGRLALHERAAHCVPARAMHGDIACLERRWTPAEFRRGRSRRQPAAARAARPSRPPIRFAATVTAIGVTRGAATSSCATTPDISDCPRRRSRSAPSGTSMPLHALGRAAGAVRTCSPGQPARAAVGDVAGHR